MGTDIWDVRLEDAERARARYDSNVAGLDSMFERAMAMKNKTLCLLTYLLRKNLTCPRLTPELAPRSRATGDARRTHS